MQITVQINDHSREWLASAAAALTKAVELTAQQGALIAQQLVAKDTGSLMDTIDYTITTNTPMMPAASINAGNLAGGYKGGSAHNSRAAGSPVDYALDQEFGLNGHNFTPFMTPMSERIKQSLIENCTTALGGAK